MPKYLNNSNSHMQIVGTDGNISTLAPGRTIETYLHYDIADLTKISDSPIYNPLVSLDKIVSTGVGDDQEIEIAAGTNRIEIINKTESEASVFWGAVTNTPSTVVPAGTMRIFSDIKGLADKLIVQFGAAVADNFYVIQTR